MGSSKPNHKENPRNNSKGRSGGGGSIEDPRFSSANWDPRFREAPKYKSKVKIDSRFTRPLLQNQSFAQSKAPIDKRGKRKRKGPAFESFDRYYRLEGEQGSAKRKKNVKGDDGDSDSDTESVKLKTEGAGTEKRSSKIIKASKIKESQIEDEEFEGKKSWLKLKSQPESSEEEEEVEGDSDDSSNEEEEVEVDSDDSSTSSSDIDVDQDYEEEEETFGLLEDNIQEIDKETHRLAVVNMDWSYMQAVDLFVAFSSFLPKGGQIKSVSVYPSEFGLKRMEEEAIHGPIGIFDNDKKKSGGDRDEDEDGDEDENVDESDDEDDDNGSEEEDEDTDADEDEDVDDDDVDNEKLRAYELSRLRYYFAVVECDSVATADYLYKGCDGVQFERSSVKLDLRFIPDSMEFKQQPRDVATEAPSNYEGLDFFNRPLQHSNINQPGDDDEPHREKALKRAFNADQLADLKLPEFLASDESDSDDSEDDNNGRKDPDAKKKEKQALYRALLESKDDSDENDKDDGEDLDMEVTFNTDLEDLSKRILEKKDSQVDSVWDAHRRKMKEKRKARKNRSKDQSDDESSDNTDKEAASDEGDDFFVEESSGKASKKARGKASKKDHDEKDRHSEATEAELELLIADDNGETDSNPKGYNLKRKKKGKTGKEIQDEGKLPTIDYDDPRFSAVLTNPQYSLDPTDPQFKRSATYARQLAQKQQKGEKEEVGQTAITSTSTTTTKDANEEDNEMDKSKKEKAKLSSLVRSLKMKTKQMAPQSSVFYKSSSRARISI